VWRPDDASAGTLAHILPSGLASPKGLDFEKSDADITKDTVKEFSEIMAHEVRRLARITVPMAFPVCSCRIVNNCCGLMSR
jgi:hypothetical protein